MAPSYERDRNLADRYLPIMKSILAQHLILTAPEEDDIHHATDLLVLRSGDIRIACRVRRHGYAAPYGHQFTIRSSRPSGATTELHKILDGWGDYIIYGFEDERGEGLYPWLLGDLTVFRSWWGACLRAVPGQAPGFEKSNDDGSSCFRVFTPAVMPASFLVAAVGYTGHEPITPGPRRDQQIMEIEIKSHVLSPRLPGFE